MQAPISLRFQKFKIDKLHSVHKSKIPMSSVNIPMGKEVDKQISSVIL